MEVFAASTTSLDCLFRLLITLRPMKLAIILWPWFLDLLTNAIPAVFGSWLWGQICVAAASASKGSGTRQPDQAYICGRWRNYLASCWVSTLFGTTTEAFQPGSALHTVFFSGGHIRNVMEHFSGVLLGSFNGCGRPCHFVQTDIGYRDLTTSNQNYPIICIRGAFVVLVCLGKLFLALTAFYFYCLPKNTSAWLGSVSYASKPDRVVWFVLICILLSPLQRAVSTRR